ncbi:uncharacterized protein [Primulina eburnea]|uniref:uncharacterized protein n=1 Tax=Primulina eburnea TaxID=1245227 RepID=UPI003C6C0FC0
MVLEVDLQCSSCYKKIKKILCKFPQIRNQVYDEKRNTVTVTVVCCSPEKCRDKLFSKGGKVIKSIEIKEPAKPKEPEKKKETEKPKEPEKPKVIVVEKPKEPEKPKVVVVEPEKPKPDGGKPQDKPKEAPKAKGPEPDAKPPPPEPAKLQAANPVNGTPPVIPAMACYGPSYDGFGGGLPWYNGYGIPPPPQPRFDGYYGYEYGYPYGRSSNFNRCDAYFSEENPSACSIM